MASSPYKLVGSGDPASPLHPSGHNLVLSLGPVSNVSPPLPPTSCWLPARPWAKLLGGREGLVTPTGPTSMWRKTIQLETASRSLGSLAGGGPR